MRAATFFALLLIATLSCPSQVPVDLLSLGRRSPKRVPFLKAISYLLLSILSEQEDLPVPVNNFRVRTGP